MQKQDLRSSVHKSMKIKGAKRDEEVMCFLSDQPKIPPSLLERQFSGLENPVHDAAIVRAILWFR
jgi:CTP:molybdopterin cytidylyltransferase MocA